MSVRGFFAGVFGCMVLASMALPQQPSGGRMAQDTVAGKGRSGESAVPAAESDTVRNAAARKAGTDRSGTSPAQSTRRVVDFEADVMRPVKIGDSSVLNLLGNVIFYHNGAVITCDSAIRYNAKRMECFKNVVINKDSTYIYGDRADYNGDLNIARVYGPIIKMVDGDATLYTYNFSFNTLDNIGQYSGGGTMSQKDNLLESKRGYYYADTRDMICVEEVELRNPDYRIKSDSAGYNMDTEIATFYLKTYIWNEKGEILSADRGSYDRKTADYRFTSDAYILTRNQELWADSLDYNSATEDAVLRRDIQLRDEEHKVIAFGDYGLYWGGRQEAMLTKEPAMVNYDPKQDTLYMRSDSMFLYTVPHGEGRIIDSLVETSDEELIDSLPADTTLRSGDGLTEATEQTVVTEDIPQPGQEKIEESIDTSGGGSAPLTKEERKRLKAEEKRLKRAAKEAARAARQGKKNVLEEPGDPEESGKGKVPADSLSLRRDERAGQEVAADTLAERTTLVTPARIEADSLLAATPADTTAQDSVDRIVRAYHNVRIFRSDFQAVCDSLVAFSYDSTAHLYIDPVLWSENNQVISEIIDIYSRNQQIEKAVFVGEPIMISQVDSAHFNQVKGKVIEALFRNNEIYRTDVNGNGQTYYYMTEDDRPDDIIGFLVAECADISFFMEEKKVTSIVYRGSPVYSIYPMDKIPEEQEQFLPGFKWLPERRPLLKDVFTRTIRPSQRERYESMPQPSFPLTDAIMRHKEQMIRDGVWRERNDRISVDAQNFIRGLGY